MKWSPEQFWSATLTEFTSAWEFWCIVNDVKPEPEKITRDRNAELKAKYG